MVISLDVLPVEHHAIAKLLLTIICKIIIEDRAKLCKLRIMEFQKQITLKQIL